MRTFQPFFETGGGICDKKTHFLLLNPTFGGSARSGSAFGMGEIVDFGAASHPFGFRSPIFKK